MLTFAASMITAIFSLIGIIILAFLAGMIAFVIGCILMKMKEEEGNNDEWID